MPKSAQSMSYAEAQAEVDRLAMYLSPWMETGLARGRERSWERLPLLQRVRTCGIPHPCQIVGITDRGSPPVGWSDGAHSLVKWERGSVARGVSPSTRITFTDEQDLAACQAIMDELLVRAGYVLLPPPEVPLDPTTQLPRTYVPVR